MTEPDVIDYGQRAANQPKPGDWPEEGWLQHLRISHEPDVGDGTPLSHRRADAAEMEATSLCFFADYSEFQPVVTKAYPYAISMNRADTGYRTDAHAKANHALLIGWDQIQVEGVYCVYKDGEASSMLSRLKNLYGLHPDPKLIVMTDMESGSDFAGPGNHSAGANAWVNDVAAWLGKDLRELGYANAGDWSGNWPSRPSWLNRSLANYSSNPTPSGYYARQYYGALNYPVPTGYPTSCKPFGTYVDMNVIPRPIAQVLLDFGITEPKPPAPPKPPIIQEDDMLVRFPDGKTPTTVYLVTGGYLVPLTHEDWTSMGSPSWHEVTPASGSNLYKLEYAPGFSDSRK